MSCGALLQRDWTTVCHPCILSQLGLLPSGPWGLAETDSPGRAQTGTRLAASPGVSDSKYGTARLDTTVHHTGRLEGSVLTHLTLLS